MEGLTWGDAFGDGPGGVPDTARQLRETEQKFELALRAADLTIWDTALGEGTTRLSRSSAEHEGPVADTLLNAAWAELVHPDDRERLALRWREHMEGTTKLFEAEFRVKEGDAWRWVRGRGKVIERDAEGHPTRAAGVNADITAERESQEALLRAEAEHERMLRQMENIFASLPVVVWALDARGVFTFAAGAALATLRLAPEDMVGRSIYQFEKPEPSLRAIQLALAGQPTSERSVDGELEFENHYIPVFDDNGVVTGVTGVSVDVTDRSRAEQAMLQAQKLESLGVLAGGIAHDFNNILVGILGNVSLVLHELPEESPLHAIAEEIRIAGRRAADLARQMLSYAGRAPFTTSEVAMGEMLNELTHLLRVSIGDHATLKLEVEPGLPPVLGDATQLRQVLMNLVINAGDAIDGRPGTVSLSARRFKASAEDFADAHLGVDAPPGNYVEVAVSDTGPGMDRETLSRIFDPFFSTKESGRGLGLAAVLGIVRGHKGALKVTSRSGEGTTFRIFLPSATVEGKRGGASLSASALWRGHGNVLVVDDDEQVRVTVARTLRVLGYEPSVASNGIEALDLVSYASLPFALVVLDMTMPGLGGAETLEGIRELDPNVPVLIVSGYSERSAAELLERYERVRFLQKPFLIEDLRQAVGALIGSRR